MDEKTTRKLRADLLISLCFLLLLIPVIQAELDWVRIYPDTTLPYKEGHNMTFDIAHEVSIMFAGYAYSQRNPPLYIYDGYDWKIIEPFGDWPSARAHYGMTYDASREVVVIFGGYQGSADYLGDTWEWDGENWEEKFPAHKPSDRTDLSMTYDSFNEVVVLFGGYDDSHVLKNDLWEWDGYDWTEISSFPAPEERGCSQIVYDEIRNRIVLFGGAPDSSTELDDTWEWDGTSWEEIITPHKPNGKRSHILVYDSHREVVVLFGGNDNPVGLSDETWEYDSIDWYQIHPAHHPSERTNLTACYDSVRNRTVLFGGYAYGAQNDTWEYYDVPTPTVTPTITPTATPTLECPETGVTLEMPSHNFNHGDNCYLIAYICIQEDYEQRTTGNEPLSDIPFFCLLEAASSYWYYPTWIEEISWKTIEDLPHGETVLTVIESFTWPDDVGSATGLRFIAAITDPEMKYILGNYSEWEFGW